jgi:hypothetical protein
MPMPMLRRGFLPMTTILAAVTALTLVYAAAMVADLPAGAPLRVQADNAAVVRTFYGAVNIALRDGDRTALASTVRQDAIVHRSAPESVVYGDTFVDRILALHMAYPALQVTVEDVIAERERVLVQISVKGVESFGLFGVPIPATTTKGPTEVFRVEDSVVAEYQGLLADLSAPSKVLQETVTTETVHGAVGVARITMTPPAALENLVTVGPTIFALDAGTLTISIDGQGAIRRAPVRDTVPPGDTTTVGTVDQLQSGDQLALSKDARYTLRSTGPDTAVITATTIMPSNWLDFATYDRVGPAPQYPLSAMMYLADTSERRGAPWPRGVSRQPLLQGDALRLPTNPISITLWKISLPSGTSVSGYAPASSTYIIVMSGQALIESFDQDQNGTMTGLMGGQWSALDPHELTTTSTVGDAPATLLVLTIQSINGPATLAARSAQSGPTHGDCRNGKTRCGGN